jgi:hypothetical protein
MGVAGEQRVNAVCGESRGGGSMHIGRRASGIAAVVALFAIGTGAAAEDQKTEGSGFAVALQGGVATGASETGITLGGAMTYDVSPRLSVELTGAYLDRGRAESGASGLASLLVNLRPSGEKVVPYLAVGGGVYHTSFSEPAWRDALGDFELPPGFELPGGFPRPGGFTMPPGFDGGRFGRWRDALAGVCGERGGCSWLEGDGRRGGRESSTDGAITLGGGIRIDLGHGLFVRPDLRAIVIFGEDTRTLGVLNVGVGYRF